MAEQGWEKTVMRKKIIEIFDKGNGKYGYPFDPDKEIYRDLFKAGMKEVVEWIEEETTDIHSNGVMLTFYTKEWQQFLKEKGLC